MEGPSDGDAPGDIFNILKSLTWNTSSSLSPRSPSKTETEQSQKDMMEQLTQMMKTEMEQSQKDMMEQRTAMEMEIGILKSESEKNHSEIANLLASEKEDKAEMGRKINSLNEAIQQTVNFVGSLITRLAASEGSIKVLKEKGSKVDTTIEGFSSISEKIEVRFTEVNENIQRVKELGEDRDNRIQSNLEVSKSREMEAKISSLQTESEKSNSEIANLRSQLASEKEGRAKMEAKIKKTVEVVRSKLAAAEESIKVLKERGSTREASVNEAIERLSTISPQIEVRFTEVNKNIQKVKKSGEENLELSRRSFSMVDGHHERFRYDLQDIKIEMKNLENRMQSEIQVTVETDKNRSGATDKIQKQNLTMLELRQRKMPEVPLTPATAEGGDGSESDIPTTISDDEEMEEEAVPQEQEIPFPLSSVPGSGSVGQEMSSKNKKRKLPPPSTTVQNQNVTHAHDRTKTDGVFCICGRQCSKVRTLETHILYYSTATSEKKFLCSLCPQRFLWLGYLRKHQLNKHKINPAEGFAHGCRKCGQIFRTVKGQLAHFKFCNGGQVKKVQETSKARPLAPSPPKPSTSKSTSVAENKTRRRHGTSVYRPMFCRCGQTLGNCNKRPKPRRRNNSIRAVNAVGQEHKLVPHPPPTSSSEQSGSAPEGSNSDRFFCHCGKSYASKRGVWRHITNIGVRNEMSPQERP